ncbi:hypothetical protein ACSQ67_001660 [Phaseolus vulgaris]
MMVFGTRSALRLPPKSHLNNFSSFFCSQSLTLCESDPKYQHRLKKVQKLEDLLNRGRTITARRFLKSLFLSKTTFSSLCELHAHVSKPLFSDTLLWLCSVSKMLNEATDLYFSMRKDGFLPSTRSVNRLLRTLVASRHFEKTLSVFADVVDSDIQPDVITYGKAVQAAVMLKDLDKGFDLVSSMEKEGLGPYVFAYNLILGGLCKVRRIKDARKLFDEMIRRNIAPNTVTCNTLIDGYCKVGELEEAFGFKERMKELNVECNLVTYNCLLSGLCGSGRVEEARKVLLEMEGCGFLPCGFLSVVFDGHSNVAGDHSFFDGKEIMIDERTYCILLNGLCRVGRIEKAEEVLAKLVHNGVTPSRISYNILVNAYCEEGDVKKATLAIEEMEERGLQPNRITFNTLISKFCETGEVDQAETWVKRMIEKDVSPTVETYNSLIHGYGQRGHFVRSFEILEEMEKAGIKPNVISYGSLINCLCKDRKLLDAEIVLADMIGRGVSPNAEIYNMLIEASFALSKLKDAFRFFDEMVQGGIDATLVTYNTMINGLGRNERVKEAEDLALQMVGKGCNPDVVTYNSLISGYAKSVNTQKCIELYDKMKMVGIKPTIGTFHPLIYACRKVGLAEVERMFQEMLQMDLIPDRFVYNEMIYSYAEYGNVLKAVSLHQQMLDQGVDSDKVTYNCLILAYLRDRRVSEIKHIVDDMKAKGLVPKADTYNILVKGHCDLKDFNGAYFWYREMTDGGLLLNARMCSLLISGLREEGMLLEAQIVDLACSDGTFARAAVPSGASTGIVHSFLSTTICHCKVAGFVFSHKEPDSNRSSNQFHSNRSEIRRTMDSLGFVEVETPVLQEFMVLPVGASSFKEAMKMGVEVYHKLKSVIKKKYGQEAVNVGDEGGFAPNIQENKEGLGSLKTVIAKAVTQAKSRLIVSWPFRFDLQNSDGSQKISGDALKDLYKSFVSEYPIVSIEDPFDQDDWGHYSKLTAEVGTHVQIVGDDLLVTNPKVSCLIKQNFPLPPKKVFLFCWSPQGFSFEHDRLYIFGNN